MTSESNAEPAEAWKMLDQAVVVRAVVVGQSSSSGICLIHFHNAFLQEKPWT